MRRMMMAGVCVFVVTTTSAMAQSNTDYLDMTRVQVRGDKSKEFEDAIKKLAEVNRKYKGDRWVALSTEYGEFGGYTFSSTRENLAAVETGVGAFQKALKEGMGPMGEKLMRDISSFSMSGHSELRHRRWDLSVNRPSSNAELLKTVAQTRWIRTLTLNMKPGRNLQYIDAWKGFMGELEKMTPAAPIFVSESSTGSPALFVGVYYKSWAEMDTGAASLQKALASAAYGRLTMATQEAVESSRWDILKFRPELSNPPDEVIAADPAFWKPAPPAAPKPKMAAAEKK